MSFYLPYPQLNMAEGTYVPSAVHNINNATFAFWQRALFQRAISTLEISVPSKWRGEVRDFLLYCLFSNGFIGVFDRNETGLSFQPGTVYGFDFYYQPTRFLFANPAVKGGEKTDLEIGTECALIKLTPDYKSAFDIINYFAEKLSLLDTSINLSIINSRFGYLLGAKNKSAAAAIKKIFDKLNSGKPAVVYDERILDDRPGQSKEGTPFQFIDRKDLKAGYITTDQLNDFQTLLNRFDAEIGIPTNPVEKKERMNSLELMPLDTISRSVTWFETLSSSLEVARELYPELEAFTVSLRWRDLAQQEGGQANVTGENDIAGIL